MLTIDFLKFLSLLKKFMLWFESYPNKLFCTSNQNVQKSQMKSLTVGILLTLNDCWTCFHRILLQSAVRQRFVKMLGKQGHAPLCSQGCRYVLEMTGSSVSISWKLTDSILTLSAISQVPLCFFKNWQVQWNLLNLY